MKSRVKIKRGQIEDVFAIRDEDEIISGNWEYEEEVVIPKGTELDHAVNLEQLNEKADEFDNRGILEEIDGTDISNWDSAFQDSHTHTNKPILDGIDSSDIGNWDDAYSKAHVHANKSILDSILQGDLDNWNEAYNKVHTHANKTILDGISSSDIGDWEEAYNKKVNAISFTGDTNKTLTVTREDGTTLTAAFLDNNDPQFPDDVLNTLSFNDNNDGVLRAITSLGEVISTSLDGRYNLLGHKHVWTDITDRPTSLSDFTNDLGNYGNWITKAQGDTYYSAIGHTHTFASLTSKPTTIAGYGITDFNSLGDARWALRTRTISAGNGLTGGGNLTANRTIGLSTDTQEDIAKGVTAHGWGNHADENYATETYVGGAIDDIEIGGRNLLLKSDVTVTNSIYSMTRYTYTEPIAEDEECTVTIWGELGSDRRDFSLYNSGGTTKLAELSKISEGVYRGSFNWRVNNTPNTYLRIYQTLNDGTTASTINRIKLERGNKATDWSPAPEDQVTDWDETNPESYSFLKNKPTDLATQNWVNSQGFINDLSNYYTKTEGDARFALRIRTITGTGGLTGGGSLTANRTIALSTTTQNDIAKGVTAHGWGDYREFGLGTGSYGAITDITSSDIHIGRLFRSLESGHVGSILTMPFDGTPQTNLLRVHNGEAYINRSLIRAGDTPTWHRLWHNGNLSNPATQTWVNSQGFLKTAQAPLTNSTTNTISGTQVRRAALTGDVTASANSNTTTIANSAVTHAKYQNIATQRILGRGATGTGNVQELTLGANLSLSTAGVLSATNTNTTYSVFTRSANGLVPRPTTTTTTRYLREDGSWVVPPNTNTTYSAGSLALLNAGTNTSNRVWSSKVIADYVKSFNLGFPGTDKDILLGDGTTKPWVGVVNSNDSIALGESAKATGVYSAAIQGIASGNYSYAFGGYALGVHSISIGNASRAINPHGIAIGSNAEVEVNNHPTYNGGIAIGGGAKSKGINSIALGRGAIASPHNYMKIGGDTPSDRIDHIEFTGQTLEFGRDDVASRFYMYSADGQKWQVGITTNGTLSIAPVGVIG